MNQFISDEKCKYIHYSSSDTKQLIDYIAHKIVCNDGYIYISREWLVENTEETYNLFLGMANKGIMFPLQLKCNCKDLFDLIKFFNIFHHNPFNIRIFYVAISIKLKKNMYTKMIDYLNDKDITEDLLYITFKYDTDIAEQLTIRFLKNGNKLSNKILQEFSKDFIIRIFMNKDL